MSFGKPVIGDNIALAARRLQNGKLVAFPTETVYGLGALANHPQAIAKIYRTKNRPRHHPLIVHLPNRADVAKWAITIPPAAKRLMRAFMPGALTLVLPRREDAPAAVCGGGDYIALRTPAHPVAKKLLQQTGAAIAAPSANRFGSLSATCAEDVAAEFAGCDIYILRGSCNFGIESAIVGFYGGKPSLLRPGGIGKKQLRDVAGLPFVSPPSFARAPGMLPRHYAPKTPLIIIGASGIAAAVKTAKHPAVLSARKPAAVQKQRWRRAQADAEVYAQELYKLLRQLDNTKADKIFVAAVPSGAKWAAVRDRLSRASNRQ